MAVSAAAALVFLGAACGGSSLKSTSAPVVTEAPTTTIEPMEAARVAYGALVLATKPLFAEVSAFYDANGIVPWADIPRMCLADLDAARVFADGLRNIIWPPAIADEADAAAKAYARDASTAERCSTLPGTAAAQADTGKQFADNRSGQYRTDFEFVLG
jgi:hypothetical protein